MPIARSVTETYDSRPDDGAEQAHRPAQGARHATRPGVGRGGTNIVAAINASAASITTAHVSGDVELAPAAQQTASTTNKLINLKLLGTTTLGPESVVLDQAGPQRRDHLLALVLHRVPGHQRVAGKMPGEHRIIACERGHRVCRFPRIARPHAPHENERRPMGKAEKVISDQ